MAQNSVDDDGGDGMGLSERIVERRQVREAESPRFRFSGVVQLGQIIQFVGVLSGGIWLAYSIGDWRAGYDAKLANASLKLVEIGTRVDHLDEAQRALAVMNQRFASDEAAIARLEKSQSDFADEMRKKIDQLIASIGDIKDRLPRSGGGR